MNAKKPIKSLNLSVNPPHTLFIWQIAYSLKIIHWTNLYSENEKKKKYPDSIMQALFYINNHLSEDLKLEHICQKIGYCKRQLQNLFIKHLGISPRQYIIRNELNAVALSLKTQTNPLKLFQRYWVFLPPRTL